VVPFRDDIKLPGVTLDVGLTMDCYITEVIRSCYYHTRPLRHIGPLLKLDAAKITAHGMVAARLDYCNALLNGMSANNFSTGYR